MAGITKGLGIVESAVSLREYHKMFVQNCVKQSIVLEKKIAQLKEKCDAGKSDVKDFAEEYKKLYNLDVSKFPEYQKNRYISGEFMRIAKGVYLNRKEGYEITAQTFAVYNLAFLQKKLFVLEKEYKKAKTYAKINYKTYSSIVNEFYTAVHKQMVLKGYGYQYEHPLGYVFINRVMNRDNSPVLDTVKSMKNKERLLAEGKNVYDKDKIEWCAKHGIPYDYVDHREWRIYQFNYEIALLSRRAHSRKNTFKKSRWRSTHLPSKTLDGLVEFCNRDMNKICELDIDLPSKISMCLSIDPTLGLKYIRNENQKSYKSTRTRRKNRQ